MTTTELPQDESPKGCEHNWFPSEDNPMLCVSCEAWGMNYSLTALMKEVSDLTQMINMLGKELLLQHMNIKTLQRSLLELTAVFTDSVDAVQEDSEEDSEDQTPDL